MKRYNPLLFILVCIIGHLLPMTLYGEEVSPQKAMAVANSIFSGQPAVKSGGGSAVLLWDSNDLAPDTKTGNNAPAYYVFAPSGATGFAIIAGDDIIEPVLGYSLTNSAPETDDLPDALKAWLKDIEDHIAQERAKGSVQDAATAAAWQRSVSYSDGKLLETALWKQREPFNNDCPVYNGKRTLTGCTSTAIGIIMYYHKWPDAGVGTTPYYTTEKNKINVGGRNLEAPYDWGNMLPKYTSNSYTDAQAKAVSRLLADIGAALQANYGTESTGAVTAGEKICSYFKYDYGITRIARKDYFEEQYDNILKSEIDNNRPVLYSGTNAKEGGHAFVLDGYDNTGKFHINWGWGGSSNGYFAITDHEYNIHQDAHVRVMPESGQNNVPEYWITLYNKGMVSSVQNIDEYNATEYFSVRLLLNNRNGLDFNGYIRIGVVDKQGELKGWAMDERSFELNGRLNTSAKPYKSVTVNCKLPQEPQTGDKLRLYYRTQESGWKLVITDPVDWNDVVWELPVADTHTIRESTSIRYEKSNEKLIFAHKKGVKATLLLDGGEVSDGVVSDSLKTVIDVKKLSGRKYTIRLEKNGELEEVEFSVENK